MSTLDKFKFVGVGSGILIVLLGLSTNNDRMFFVGMVPATLICLHEIYNIKKD